MREKKDKQGKKGVVLYNIFLPIWLIFAIPPVLLVTLPVNYIIDYWVCRISLKKQNKQEYKAITKKLVWKIWIVGFLSDFIGIVVMFLSEIIFGGNNFGGHIVYSIEYNCFSNIFGFLYVILCIGLSGVLIYFINLKLVLRKVDSLSLSEKKKLCLHLAIFTAPYTFLIPTSIR